MESVTIDKKALANLVRLKEEFDLVVESLELMSDKDFMESHKRAKEQIKKREFANWDDLQNSSN